MSLQLPSMFNQTLLSITINPDNDGQLFNNLIEDRFTCMKKWITSRLLNSETIEQVVLIPDLSWPEYFQYTRGKKGLRSTEYKQARCHYHGWLIVDHTKAPEMITNEIYKLSNHCMVNIDTIDDFPIWHEYCTKFTNKFPKYNRYTIVINSMHCNQTQDIIDTKNDLHSYLIDSPPLIPTE